MFSEHVFYAVLVLFGCSGAAYGATTSYLYDALHRVIDISQVEGTSTTYTYDPAGNRTTMVRTILDTDTDGLSDAWETYYFGGLAEIATDDFDGDGLTNAQEQATGTDPTMADTDGDGTSDGAEVAAGSDPLAPLDHLPVAHAGPIRIADPGPVTLDGSNSADPNSDPLTYHWSQDAANPMVVAFTGNDSPTAAAPTLLVNRAGTYTFALVVDDGTAASPPDTVQLMINDLPPVAQPGPAHSVHPGDAVTLAGDASFDPNGELLTYAWNLDTAPPGSLADLSDASVIDPILVPDVDGTYQLSLMVNNGTADSPPATVEVLATTGNAPPVARSGPDLRVKVGEAVTADGRDSADADGDLLTYAWALTPPAGSGATLVPPDAVLSSLISDLAGDYLAALTVDDGTQPSTPVSATITATDVGVNAAPTARAGVDLHAKTGTPLFLDGAASADADGDPLMSLWSFTALPAGSTATLAGELTATPTFAPDLPGEYVVTLRVSDATASDVDNVVVHATDSADNGRPTAVAGPDLTVGAGTLVQLDGTGSFDPDGPEPFYAWAFVSLPTGSAATLSAPTAGQPTFTPDMEGDYVVRLVVDDGVLTSAPSTLVVHAGPAVDTDADGWLDLSDNCPTVFNDLQEDTDGDGAGDACDSCTQVANATQVDTDGDHFGNACDGDFNNLHPVVNAFDLGQMRQALGKAVTDTTCPCDDGTLACSCAEFDLNGLHPVINAFDLGIFRGLLGKPPGPSAW